jgi:hypothetical protein
MYSHQLSPEELETVANAAANEELPGLKETPPTTLQFKEQVINKFWQFNNIKCED